jgi:hypothetical protein
MWLRIFHKYYENVYDIFKNSYVYINIGYYWMAQASLLDYFSIPQSP